MSWIALEFLCPSGHRSSSLEDRKAVRDPIPFPVDGCDLDAKRTISAPRLKFARGVVSRGRNYADDRPPSVADTSLLADGMSLDEWKNHYTPEERPDEDLARATDRVLGLTEDKVV